MSPDTGRTMRVGKVGIGLALAVSPAAAKSCRGQRRPGTRSSSSARCASGVCGWYRHRP